MITHIILLVAAALLVGVYVSWRAGRIDRLHARVDMARAALDATLLRRSSVALELATSGLLDPATSLLLASAVHGTRSGPGGPKGSGGKGFPPGSGGSRGVAPPGRYSHPEETRPRDLAESDLTRALRAAFSQPGFRSSLNGREGADELLAEMEAASHQVFLARKFYNDLVAVTRDARRRPLARVLRLSGKAEIPVFFEMDDSLIAEKTGPLPAHPSEPEALDTSQDKPRPSEPGTQEPQQPQRTARLRRRQPPGSPVPGARHPAPGRSSG